VDALVLRDQSSQHNGTLDQRLYVQQDADGNVTALVGTTGSVLERYAYDPYGAVTIMSPSWSTIGASAYGAIYLWQGKRYDGSVGLYDSRGRVYSPALMRPLQADPLGLGPDVNDYRWEGNGPTGAIDPSGLSGAGDHHPYPLMLGGSDDQPLFGLSEEEHTAAEEMLKQYGFHNHNHTKGNNAARARWAALSVEEHRMIIIESLKAANVPDSYINQYIDDIMKGAKPGVNRTLERGTGQSKNWRVPIKRVGGQALNMLGIALQLYYIVTECIDNAPVAGHGKGSRFVEAPWTFHDDGGDFQVQIIPGWFSDSYRKHYIRRITPGPTDINISEAEKDYFERIGRQRWGYKQFNWWTWEWEFIEGTERKSLPVRIKGGWDPTDPDQQA
jgi:RHS repeat-associated protein